MLKTDQQGSRTDVSRTWPSPGRTVLGKTSQYTTFAHVKTSGSHFCHSHRLGIFKGLEYQFYQEMVNACSAGTRTLFSQPSFDLLRGFNALPLIPWCSRLKRAALPVINAADPRKRATLWVWDAISNIGYGYLELGNQSWANRWETTDILTSHSSGNRPQSKTSIRRLSLCWYP